MTRTCSAHVPIFVSHSAPIPPCCPVSGNPRPGSKLTICYLPNGVVFPVEDLATFIAEYVGGRGSIRGMEEMIQEIAVRVCDTIGVPVRAIADLVIQPPFGGDKQTMRVSARAHSASRPDSTGVEADNAAKEARIAELTEGNWRIRQALVAMLGGKCPECHGWGEVAHFGEIIRCRCGGNYRYTPSESNIDAARAVLRNTGGEGNG